MQGPGQNILQNKLLEAMNESRVRNPQYSLRAFSKRLGLSPAALSEVLRGKRNVSIAKATDILGRLAVGPEEQRRILASFAAVPGLTVPDSDGGKLTRTSETPMSDHRQLTLDQFQATSEWYHFAILSLAETKGFKGEPAWIAKRLNLSLRVATDALDRLLRLGLLKKVGRKVVMTGEQFTTTDEIRNAALRRAHSENLDLARRSLESDDITARDFTSMTMAMSPSIMPLAKKRIRAFLQDLSNELEVGDKTDVYKINVQLFSLTNPEPEMAGKGTT